MSARFALAVEEAKKFRAQLANVFDVLDYVSRMENPADLEASIARLKAKSTELIASYRANGEAEAKRGMEGAVKAAELKVKDLLAEGEKQKAELIRQGQAEANRLIAEAKRAGEKITQKFAEAHEAAQAKLR